MSQNSTNQGFSYYFCLMIEGSGSMLLTNGSGSAIRMEQKNVDPVDPDPEHWLKLCTLESSPEHA
jgi:hypothetical protein